MLNIAKSLEQNRFNARALVEDLGGVREVAKRLGVSRSAPYRWISSGAISSRTLERIVTAFPDTDLNKYFAAQGVSEANENT